MKTVSLSDICYVDWRFEISDVFHEDWKQRKDFSLYKNRPRPCSALFFVCSDVEVSFFPADGGAAVTAKKGDAVFIPKDSLYWVSVGGNVGGNSYTYTVNADMFDERGEELRLSERIAVLSTRQDNRYEMHLKSISEAFHSISDVPSVGNRRNLAKIKGEFYILLDSVASAVAQNDEYLYPIRKGAEALCCEWQKNEKIEKYAQISGVSVTYFYRCFRKWSGKSPIEYRNMLRLSNAESLLRSTDMKIQEISDAVGFEDPFYFCRIFSGLYGFSPKHYRNLYQNR